MKARSRGFVSITCAIAGAAAIAGLAIALPSSPSDQDVGDADGSAYEIALIGDMPYGDLGRAQFPAVIADINAHDVAFTTFDGDLKSGKERCDQELYDVAEAAFRSFDGPLVYVPGDNDWSDCDRPSNGSFDPNERLGLVRTMFASQSGSLGQYPLGLERQSDAYPENVRWIYGPVVYAGLNVPGGDNNAPRFDAAGRQVDGDQAEYDARNGANLAWLDESFAAARAAGSAGIAIILQANMWSGGATGHYADLKRRLIELTLGFSGQVLLVNGDSHTMVIDKPLSDAAGNVIQNFTRLQTFGNPQHHWISATVDATDPQVFTFHQHIVAANLPSYAPPATPSAAPSQSSAPVEPAGDLPAGTLARHVP